MNTHLGRIIPVLLVTLVLFFSLSGVAGAASLGPHALLTGDPNPCKVCHDTAAGTPALRGWSGTVTAFGTGWGTKSISLLCYGCHDNTGGYIIGQTASDQVANAFDDANGSHYADIAGVPEDPDGASTQNDVPASTLPYTNAAVGSELQCTSCHNVHVVTVRPFNQRGSYQLMCNECHGGRVNDASATQATPGSTRPYSTHPTLEPMAGPTGNRNMMTTATMSASLRVATPAPAGWPAGYALGGHLDDGTQQPTGTTGNINCQTCHAVHGPIQGTAGLNDLLAIENATEALGVDIGSGLCEGCHYGGAAGTGTLPGAGVGTLQVVVGQYSDHPLDGRAALWSGIIGTIPNPPVQWMAATPNLDRGAQPHLARGTPACSSCHDTHGGIENTPLLRGPAPGIYDGVPNAWTFDYDDWCFVCHLASQIIPDNHHSVLNNMNTSPDSDPFDSQLGCGDCHGAAGVTDWTAHNGFWAFGIPLSTSNSNFCQGCHVPDDPTQPQPPASTPKGFTVLSTSGSPARLPLPATHGTIRDTGSLGDGGLTSHVTNLAPDSVSNFNMDLNPVFSSGGTAEWGGANEVLCESCHNILTNGDPGAQGTRMGWQANLLLQPYEDDDPGVAAGGTPEDGPFAWSADYYGNTSPGGGRTGSDFCRACHNELGAGGDFAHNPEAHTRDSTTFVMPPTPDGAPSQPYGRATNTVMTDLTTACPDHTTADAGSASATGPNGVVTSALPPAPGGLSYPDVDQVDCDSCHRPHNADNNSYDDGSTTFTGERWLILEITDAAWGSTICAECHDTEVQCH